MLIVANPPPDAALMERLQRAAAVHPKRYRLWLVALAIGGTIALTIMEVLPYALILLVGAVWMANPVVYGLAAAAFLFLIWLFHPSLRIEGREVSSKDAPELYRHLAEIAHRLDVRGRMEVRLEDFFNAGALEGRGLLGLFGTRPVLILGVPFLATLDAPKALAVIAHELGHFSRRHGRVGHWLYRARVGWLELALQRSENTQIFAKMTVGYARWFVPFFSVRGFIHSRQAEYEADADAALIAGTRTFAQAQTWMAILSPIWHRGLASRIRTWQAENVEPPADFYERFAALARTWPEAELQELLQKALNERPNWVDTHPTLAERVAAQSEKADPAPLGTCAGAALLGERWPEILQEFNAKWARESRFDWTFDHLRIKHVLSPLLDIPDEDASALGLDQQLARAQALHTVNPFKGLATLRLLHEREPSDLMIRLAYGSALLQANDSTGAVMLEALAKERVTLLHPIYQQLLDYSYRVGNGQTERWSTLVTRAAKREQIAVDKFFAQAAAGKARFSSLTPEVQQVIAGMTGHDPRVSHAWLLDGDCTIEVPNRGSSDAIIRGLVLTVDPAKLSSSESTDDVAQRYTTALQALISPEDIPAVRAYYTTEPIPPMYQPGSKYSVA